LLLVGGDRVDATVVARVLREHAPQRLLHCMAQIAAVCRPAARHSRVPPCPSLTHLPARPWARAGAAGGGC
jgi:hypothetical protein